MLVSTFDRLKNNKWSNTYVLIIVLIVITFLAFFQNVDTDFFWRIRTGQYILANHIFPSHDIYSFTVLGKSWMDHEWLSEVIMYKLYSTWGYFADSLFYGILFSLTWVFVYRACLALKKSAAISSLVVILGIIISVPIFQVKTQIITQLLLAVTSLLLIKYSRSKIMYTLPFIFILWINLHGGWILGFGLLCLYLLFGILEYFLNKELFPKNILITTLLSFIGMFIFNPYHFDALLHPFSYYGGNNISFGFIQEWQSVDFHSIIGILFAIFLMYMIFIGLRKNVISIKNLFIIAIFTFLSLQSIRNVPLLAIISIPFISLESIDPSFLQYRIIKTISGVYKMFGYILIITLILILDIYYGNVGGNNLGIYNKSDLKNVYPVSNVLLIKKEHITGRVFTNYSWGGYLINELYPNNHVFIDGRAEVYTEKVMVDYESILNASSNWNQLTSKYNIQIYLVPINSPISSMLDITPSWRFIAQDKVSRLYIKS